jgi:hypothetical protein
VFQSRCVKNCEFLQAENHFCFTETECVDKKWFILKETDRDLEDRDLDRDNSDRDHFNNKINGKNRN